MENPLNTIYQNIMQALKTVNDNVFAVSEGIKMINDKLTIGISDISVPTVTGTITDNGKTIGDEIKEL